MGRITSLQNQVADLQTKLHRQKKEMSTLKGQLTKVSKKADLHQEQSKAYDELRKKVIDLLNAGVSGEGETLDELFRLVTEKVS